MEGVGENVRRCREPLTDLGVRGGCIYVGHSLWGGEPPLACLRAPYRGWRLPRVRGSRGGLGGQGTGGDAVPAQAVTGEEARGCGQKRGSSPGEAEMLLAPPRPAEGQDGSWGKAGAAGGAVWEEGLGGPQEVEKVPGSGVVMRPRAGRNCTHTSLRRTGCSFHR